MNEPPINKTSDMQFSSDSLRPPPYYFWLICFPIVHKSITPFSSRVLSYSTNAAVLHLHQGCIKGALTPITIPFTLNTLSSNSLQTSHAEGSAKYIYWSIPASL